MLHPSSIGISIRLGDFLHLASKFSPDTIINVDHNLIGFHDENGAYLGYIDLLSETFNEPS